MTLEVLYDTGSGEVRAWCGDPEERGNFKPKEGQAVVILPIDVANIIPGEDYVVDLDAGKVHTVMPDLPLPDYKAEWWAAKTPADKLKVLGRKAELDPGWME